MKDKNCIITFNVGSSNIKIGVYDASDLTEYKQMQLLNFEEVYSWFNANPLRIKAVGHRVVHGGGVFAKPIIIDDNNLKQLTTFIPLAPLHQKANIDAIEKTRQIWPSAMQIACFDTSFHDSIPDVEKYFAIPRNLRDKKIRRYGFHGLSYQYIASALPKYAGEMAYKKLIVAHLGSGASMCAMENLKSVSSTMGFSTLEGLMMATRCGSLDPGLILYLLQHEKISLTEIEHMLYYESGLKGVSGISGNMLTLLNNKDKNSLEASEMFCYIVAKKMGELIMTLGGVDVIVFTAGIGEHSPLIRATICQYLKWLGCEINIEFNQQNKPYISSDNSKIAVYVIKTNEQFVIADACQKLLK